jgi:hypothetical protein
MDKWDEAVNRVKNAILAEEPEAALAGALGLFADFGRTLEMISEDADRIATALEGLAKPDVSGTPAIVEPLDL